MNETRATVRYMIDDVAAAIHFFTTYLGFTVEPKLCQLLQPSREVRYA